MSRGFNSEVALTVPETQSPAAPRLAEARPVCYLMYTNTNASAEWSQISYYREDISLTIDRIDPELILEDH